MPLLIPPIPQTPSVIPKREVGGWGLYKEDGSPLITFSTFLEAETKGSAKVANFPLERGAFFSANKIPDPLETRVRMATDGAPSALSAMWDELLATLRGLDSVNIVTPYYTLLDMNLIGVNNTLKTDNGLGRLVVELNFQHVEANIEAVYTNVNVAVPNPKDPNAASTRDRGLQQAEEAEKSTLYKASEKANAQIYGNLGNTVPVEDR